MKKQIFLAASLVAMISCKNEEASSPETQVNVPKSRVCVSEKILEQRMKNDPSLRQRMEAIEKETSKAMENAKLLPDGTLEIPVVMNILYTNSSNNISQSQIDSQIRVLNEDFNRTNADYDSRNPFNNVRGSLKVRFVLDAVNRKQTTQSIWTSDDDMKFASSGGISASSPSTKLNFWVVPDLRNSGNINEQLLGYAQFPGGTLSTDGVVCGHYCTGVGGSSVAPFNLGRTATHEVGHWMNLRHIWGDRLCGTDRVSDTPVHNAPNRGVPPVGHRSTCSGNPLEMYMNYMDYTDDRGMYMFTSGQMQRSAAIFASNGSRRSFR